MSVIEGPFLRSSPGRAKLRFDQLGLKTSIESHSEWEFIRGDYGLFLPLPNGHSYVYELVPTHTYSCGHLFSLALYEELMPAFGQDENEDEPAPFLYFDPSKDPLQIPVNPLVEFPNAGHAMKVVPPGKRFASLPGIKYFADIITKHTDNWIKTYTLEEIIEEYRPFLEEAKWLQAQL